MRHFFWKKVYQISVFMGRTDDPELTTVFRSVLVLNVLASFKFEAYGQI